MAKHSTEDAVPVLNVAIPFFITKMKEVGTRKMDIIPTPGRTLDEECVGIEIGPGSI